MPALRFNRNHRVRDSPLDSPEQPAEYLHQTRGKLEARVRRAFLGVAFLALQFHHTSIWLDHIILRSD